MVTLVFLMFRKMSWICLGMSFEILLERSTKASDMYFWIWVGKIEKLLFLKAGLVRQQRHVNNKFSNKICWNVWDILA